MFVQETQGGCLSENTPSLRVFELTFFSPANVQFKNQRLNDPINGVTSVLCSCSSLVGFANQRQSVSLSVPGCLKHGIILHELLHALGFYHEHTRNDRDQYVEINWDNMHRCKCNASRDTWSRFFDMFFHSPVFFFFFCPSSSRLQL